VSRRPILGAFFAFGALWGAWAAIVPAVQHATGASKGELGLALLCVGLGSLPAMLLVGPRVDRHPQLLPLSLFVLGGVALLPGLAGSVWTLALALLAYGAASGLLDVAINAEVSVYETTTGRRSMQLAHAFFSTGLLVGALLAGGARQAGVGRFAILAAAGAGLAVAAVANRHPFARSPQAQRGHGSSFGLARAALAIAAVCTCAFAIEGAIENWSALYLTRDFDAEPGTAALGPAAYAVAMASGRFSGQALTRRFDDRTLLAAGGLLAFAGTTIAALAPTVPIAVAGFFLGGAGVSVVAPIAFGVAGRVAGAAGIATVTTIGYLGFLFGPPIVGGIAQAFSLRGSFVVLAAAAATIAAAALQMRWDQAASSKAAGSTAS
jgi:MFS family permease